MAICFLKTALIIGRSIPENAEKRAENCSDFLKMSRTRVVRFAICSMLAVFATTMLLAACAKACAVSVMVGNDTLAGSNVARCMASSKAVVASIAASAIFLEMVPPALIAASKVSVAVFALFAASRRSLEMIKPFEVPCKRISAVVFTVVAESMSVWAPARELVAPAVSSIPPMDTAIWMTLKAMAEFPVSCGIGRWSSGMASLMRLHRPTNAAKSHMDAPTKAPVAAPPVTPVAAAVEKTARDAKRTLKNSPMMPNTFAIFWPMVRFFPASICSCRYLSASMRASAC